MYYPGVLVNNVPYKGNLEADGVFEDICSSITSLYHRYDKLNNL
jgi:hypothetical protein